MLDASPSMRPPATALPAEAGGLAAGDAAQRSVLPAVLCLLAWLASLGLLQQCSRLPDAAERTLLLGAALLLLALSWRRSPLARHAVRATRAVALALSVGLLAFVQGAWRAEGRLAQQLPPAWEGRELLLTGRVDSLPQALQGQGGQPGWRFVFLLDAPARDAVPGGALLPDLPERLLLSWYGRTEAAAPPWRAGDRWQLRARLRQPSGLANGQGFDPELSLFEQGLRATGLVREARWLADGSAWRLDRWRQHLREAIQARVADRSSAGLIAGLSLGDQAAILPADWALFRATGVAHLMAISGLHITMFAWAAAALLGAAWRRSGRACLWLPAPTAGLWGGLAAAALYACFAGWGVPAQRTVWMLASLALLRQLGLRWPWPLSLLSAAAVVTLLDPWAIAQAGFWLSFFAVGLLMAGGEAPARGWRGQLLQGLRSQWVASLGLAPLGLLFFQQISAVGLLANLLAIPWVSFVITPLALLGSLLPAAWLLADLAISGLLVVLQALAALPGALWQLPWAPAWAQIGGLAGGVLLVLPLPYRLRLCSGLLLLPLLWPAVPSPRPGEFELRAPDVGQGSALLLRTARHSLLFDAGPQYAPGVDAGERVLLPLLRGLGLRRLDVLLLSHRDQDHVGGAAALLAGVEVGQLLSSLEPGHALLGRAGEARRCERGQTWTWDGVRFELLHPEPADYARALKPNALSCVLRVSAGAHSVLLTGDIQAAQELALVQRGGLASEVLVLAHHGSASSSTAAFLDAVAPRRALAQAGYRNRFGHPSAPVLARLQERGITLDASPDCGAWRWSSDGGEPQCVRVQQRRYWQRPLPVTAELAGPPALASIEPLNALTREAGDPGVPP